MLGRLNVLNGRASMLYLARYSATLVPKNEFPPDKYALEIAGNYYYKFLLVDD